jgi:hypothetical protein
MQFCKLTDNFHIAYWYTDSEAGLFKEQSNIQDLSRLARELSVSTATMKKVCFHDETK